MAGLVGRPYAGERASSRERAAVSVSESVRRLGVVEGEAWERLLAEVEACGKELGGELGHQFHDLAQVLGSWRGVEVSRRWVDLYMVRAGGDE